MNIYSHSVHSAAKCKSQDYCSQIHTHLPPFQKIEDGVKIIKEIFLKKVLCRHDVEEINHVYRTMDDLEKKVEIIPEQSSLEILRMMIHKITELACGEFSVKKLISLYHLKKFEDKDLQIADCYNQLFSHYNSFSTLILDNEIATHLPCCKSEDLFDEDVCSLIKIEFKQDDTISKILEQKKEKFYEFLKTKETIVTKKSELKRLREGDGVLQSSTMTSDAAEKCITKHHVNLYNKDLQKEKSTFLQNIKKQLITAINVVSQVPSDPDDLQGKADFLITKIRKHLTEQGVEDGKDPIITQTEGNHFQKYPLYLDELLDNGYILLYDHLIQMNALFNPDERKAEINKMTFSQISHVVLQTMKAIVKKVEIALPVDPGQVWFILGGSGAGKSTTLAFLRGDELVRENRVYKSKNDKDALIGHELTNSCTFLPTIEKIHNNLFLIDYPGFEDTHGPLVSLGMELALKALIKKFDSKILVLEPINNIESAKGSPVTHLGDRLKRLLGNKENCLLGITKYSKDTDFLDIEALENEKKRIENQQEKIEKEQRENLSKPTEEEIKLKNEIEFICQYHIDKPLRKEEINQRLEEIKQEKEVNLNFPLVETDEKRKNKISLQEIKDELEKANANLRGKEKEILNLIGLKDYISFDKLEEGKCLIACSEKLFESPKKKFVVFSPEKLLDSKDKALLKERFENQLMEEISNKKYEDENFSHLKNMDPEVDLNKLASNLLREILSRSNPEIIEFLYLPEIDSKVVKEFKIEIINEYINNYAKFIISEINLSSMDEIMYRMERVAPRNIDLLKKQWAFLKGLVWFELGGDASKMEQLWDEMGRLYQKNSDKVIVPLHPNSFAVIFLTTLFCLSGGVNLLNLTIGGLSSFAYFEAVRKGELGFNNRYIFEIHRERAEEHIDSYTNFLKVICDALTKMKEIKKVIQEQS
ncbi:MAG: hypothetical protein H0T62_10105 [Parachlamydiaceae bacterium]|nr:hypothetical protein [Parachlamydiaceae bacterium]